MAGCLLIDSATKASAILEDVSSTFQIKERGRSFVVGLSQAMLVRGTLELFAGSLPSPPIPCVQGFRLGLVHSSPHRVWDSKKRPKLLDALRLSVHRRAARRRTTPEDRHRPRRLDDVRRSPTKRRPIDPQRQLGQEPLE